MSEKMIALLIESKAVLISYGMSLLGAVLLLIVGWIVAGWAQRVTRRLMDRSVIFDETLKPLMATIVRYVVLIFVLIAVLAQFGVQTASIIAVLGAAGLAIGLALQGTLANIAAGAMLLILRPLRVDEFIEAGTVSGTVKEVGLFTTLMTTSDGIYISVPNSQLWNLPIKNFSRMPTRRIDLSVGIGYEDDINKALEVLTALIANEPRILKKPAAPQVMVMGLAASSVTLNIRVWTRRDDYWDVLFGLNKQVKLLLDAEGISIPFPQSQIHLDEKTLAKIAGPKA